MSIASSSLLESGTVALRTLVPIWVLRATSPSLIHNQGCGTAGCATGAIRHDHTVSRGISRLDVAKLECRLCCAGYSCAVLQPLKSRVRNGSHFHAEAGCLPC